MIDTLIWVLWWLTAAFVAAVALSVAGYFVARALFIRAAEQMAATIDRRVGAAAAGAFTRAAAYARATGVDPAEVDRRIGRHIDRVAHLMDSAVRLPIIGPVGLDAVIGLVPVVGDLAGAAVSLMLVYRSLRYAPSAALVSTMLANVLTDAVLGAIPFVGFFADIWFKANDRNAKLLRDFLDGHRA